MVTQKSEIDGLRKSLDYYIGQRSELTASDPYMWDWRSYRCCLDSIRLVRKRLEQLSIDPAQLPP